MLLYEAAPGARWPGICMADCSACAKNITQYDDSSNRESVRLHQPGCSDFCHRHCSGTFLTEFSGGIATKDWNSRFEFILQVKIQGQNEDMLLTACEQFLGKNESEIQHIALVTLEGHQRAIMGQMTVEDIYRVRFLLFVKKTLIWQLFFVRLQDRKKFSKQVFEVASSDLVNMGISVVSYTLKDIRDEEVSHPES